METEKRNPFFLDRVKTSPTKKLSLQDVLIAALGFHPVGGSKRLKSAITICNSRLFLGGKYLWGGDLNIYEHHRMIERIATKFGVVLDLLGESGDTVYWSSATPDAWLGYPSTPEKPQSLREVFPFFDKIAKEQQTQWMKDHGFSKTSRRKTRKTKSAKKPSKSNTGSKSSSTSRNRKSITSASRVGRSKQK